VSIEVTGHRWWWEVRYAGAQPEEIFTTANEIHVPVGRPVTLRLRTADVIHSFWIPQLAGKLDLIPGQTNALTFQADSAGAYWGHCAEYCGLQHAGMMMSVVADSPAAYARWLEGQRRPAATPSDGDAAAGAQVFATTGGPVCHAVRGTDAGGAIGPDLTHLASRRLIAAGLLPNTPGTLVGWIADPQAFKPGVVMPRAPLTADQIRQVVAYLQTLR
jgi:cytochrome c oxidase subunit 2